MTRAAREFRRQGVMNHAPTGSATLLAYRARFTGRASSPAQSLRFWMATEFGRSSSVASDWARLRPAARLEGEICVPGDKSISHRALLFNALAEGDAFVTNFLNGAD